MLKIREFASEQIRCKARKKGNGGTLLYWLLYEKLFHVSPYFSLFRIFRYLTFRTAFDAKAGVRTRP